MRLETRSAHRMNCAKFPCSGLVQLVPKIHWEGRARDMLVLFIDDKVALSPPERMKNLVSFDLIDTKNNLNSTSDVL